MSIKDNRYISSIYADVMNSSPLHIGCGGEEILLDKLEDKPYIPATSIAGTFKSYIASNYGQNTANYIFGIEDNMSKVFVYDAFGDKLATEKRPVIEINGKTGTTLNKHFHTTSYVASGNKFTLRFDVFDKNKNDCIDDVKLIYECLKAIDDRHIGFGGLRTSGAGQFKILKVKRIDYDLSNYEGLIDYLKTKDLNLSANFKDVTNDVKKVALNDNYVDFELDCSLKTPLLIKGFGKNEEDHPDDENIKDVNGNYIIPGNSMKGVLRNQCKKIFEYYDKNELNLKVFGNESSNGSKKIHGRVYTEDSPITNCADDNIYHRIKIDKFTGGVMKSALMNQKPILGDTLIKLRFKTFNDSEENLNYEAVGALCLALRDIGVGDLPLGSGYNVGRGRLLCKRMNVKYYNENIRIDFINKKVENGELLDKFISSLKSTGEVKAWRLK